MKRHWKTPRSIASVAAVLAFAACADSRTPTSPTEPGLLTVASPAYTVAVSPSTPTIAAGSSVQLSAMLVATARRPMVSTFTWSTSNPAVATVSGTGLVSGVGIGTATITATPADAAYGTGTSTITVTAPAVACGTPISLNVHAPVGVSSPVTTAEDTPVVFQLTATDEDLPCDVLTFRIDQSPAGGVLYQVAADSTITTVPLAVGSKVANLQGLVAFVPNPNVTGTPVGTFSYTTFDAAGQSAGTTAAMTITPVNDAPVAVAATHPTLNDVRITPLMLQMSDLETPSSVQTCIEALPPGGDLYWDGVVDKSTLVQAGDCRRSSTLAYVSRSSGFSCTVDRATDYPRTAGFKWRAYDGESYSSTVTETIAIAFHGVPPVLLGPVDQSVQEDGAVDFQLTGYDPDQSTMLPRLTFILAALPAHGTLRYNGAAITSVPFAVGASSALQLTYAPNPNFNTTSQPERFRLRMADDQSTRDCDYVMNIHVAPVNDAPTIGGPAELFASRATDGTVTPAGTVDLRVADDAEPAALLTVTLRAQGGAAGSVGLVDPAGLSAVLQVGPTELRLQGTLAALNTAFGRGVIWAPNAGPAIDGALVVTVDDGGSGGGDGATPLVAAKTIPVIVAITAAPPVTGGGATTGGPVSPR